MIVTPSTPSRQPLGPVAANPQAIVGSLALLNFREHINPPNRAIKAPSGLVWTNAGTNQQICTQAGIGVFNGAVSSGLQYGGLTSFDSISGANAPFCAVFEIVHGAYVNNGIGQNCIWSKGSIGSTVGIYSFVDSSNVVYVKCGNTTIIGPTLVDKRRYRIVAGRNSSGTCWLWIDGKLYASGSGATAAHTGYALYLLRDSLTTKPYQGSITLFGLSGDNPESFGARLSANPWALLYTSPLVILPGDVAGGSHILTSADCSQDATSGTGAIAQTHALSGASCLQDSSSGTGVVTQSHVMVAADCSQGSTSGTGAVTQAHTLATADCDQSATSSAGAATQTHALSGADCLQAAVSGDGAIIVGDVHILTAADCIQAAISGSGAVAQNHYLISASCSQSASSSSVAIAGGMAVLASRRSAKHVARTGRPKSLSTGRRTWHS